MGFFSSLLSPVTEIVGGILGADSQADAARDAANAQRRSAQESNALARYMYDTSRADMKPFYEIGLENLQRYNDIMSNPFKESEAYKFNLNETINALDKSAVAGGVSRNTDIMNRASGLASQEENNWLNRLAGLGATGSNAAGMMGQYGNAYANQVMGNNRYAGDASAQAALVGGQSKANMWNMLGGLPGNILSTYNSNQTQTSAPYSYGNALSNAQAPTPIRYKPGAYIGQFGNTAYGM